MKRNKRKSIVANSTSNQAAQAESQPQNEQLPPEEVTHPVGSEASHPTSSLPKAPFNSIKDQLRAARRLCTNVEVQSFPLPNDGIEETHREIWQRMGFYSNHPNHNPTVKNEAYVKCMMEKSHKLSKVVAQYRLYINKPMGKRAMLIQFPNREVGHEYRAASGNQPSEIRMKPKTGLVEIDIPVDIHVNYQKEKGVEYGEAMRKSRLLQEGGSYSLGGGFGIGSKETLRGDRRVPPPDGPTHEKLMENFDDANNKGHVMNKMTLGGQIYPFRNGDPIYMAATFKESERTRSCHYEPSC